MYEYRPYSFVITFGNKLYTISEVVLPPAISLTTVKQCSKIVSQTRKLIFIYIHPQDKKNIVAIVSKQGSPAW